VLPYPPEIFVPGVSFMGISVAHTHVTPFTVKIHPSDPKQVFMFFGFETRLYMILPGLTSVNPGLQSRHTSQPNHGCDVCLDWFGGLVTRPYPICLGFRSILQQQMQSQMRLVFVPGFYLSKYGGLRSLHVRKSSAQVAGSRLHKTVFPLP